MRIILTWAVSVVAELVLLGLPRGADGAGLVLKGREVDARPRPRRHPGVTRFGALAPGSDRSRRVAPKQPP